MYRGPERHLVLPSQKITALPDRLKRLKGAYFYVGPFHPHYGHYLLSTLSRFWPLAHDKLNGRKILYDSAGPADEKFKHSHVSVTMNALGVSPEDFSHVSEPMWVDDVIVPEPAFCEQLEVYDEYGVLARTITTRVQANFDDIPKNKLVYLSKTQLNGGVWRIKNEIELEDVLKNMGVSIVYPETIDFEKQIAVFNRGNHIMSTMGSLAHTAVFSNSNTDMSLLCRQQEIISNFTLIDQARYGSSEYYLPRIVPAALESNWSASFILENPVETAKKLYEQARHRFVNQKADLNRL